VTARDATPDETPKGAARLAGLAREHDWTVRVTYAKGTAMGNRGEAKGIVESVAVRLRREAQRAVALWLRPDSNWQTDGAWLWTVGQWPQPVGVRAVTVAVSS
jgi:hypothetical protein